MITLSVHQKLLSTFKHSITTNVFPNLLGIVLSLAEQVDVPSKLHRCFLRLVF